MARRSKTLVGLDIGSTRVTTIVAESESGQLKAIGYGEAESRGLKKGVVVNLEATVDAIRKSVGEAELMAGREVEDVFVGLAGPHVRSFNSKGAIPISTHAREITREDVRRVIETARAVALAPDREIIHIIPQEFVVDDEEGIEDPQGMMGTRLEVNVHIVTSSVTAAQNIVTAVHRSGLEVADTVLEPIAAGETTLTDDEKELGCVLVDIGGGKTSVAIYHHGAVRHTVVLPVGSDNFTNDIAVGLRTPIPDAERLKREHGCALASMSDDELAFEVVGVGSRHTRTIGQRVLGDILQPRAEEIVHFVGDEIRSAGFERQAGAGVVLTGGGALLDGLAELVEGLLDLPVRIGLPEDLGEARFSRPEYATAIGLVAYGQRRRRTDEFHEQVGGTLRRMVAKFRSFSF